MVHKSTTIIPHYQYLLAITDPFWIDVGNYAHRRRIHLFSMRTIQIISNVFIPNIFVHYQITDFHLLPPSLGSRTDDI
jgi:hypothetical protein